MASLLYWWTEFSICKILLPGCRLTLNLGNTFHPSWSISIGFLCSIASNIQYWCLFLNQCMTSPHHIECLFQHFYSLSHTEFCHLSHTLTVPTVKLRIMGDGAFSVGFPKLWNGAAYMFFLVTVIIPNNFHLAYKWFSFHYYFLYIIIILIYIYWFNTFFYYKPVVLSFYFFNGLIISYIIFCSRKYSFYYSLSYCYYDQRSLQIKCKRRIRS